MKKILLLLLAVCFLVACAAPAFSWDPVLVKKAQSLKSKGDYKGAAAVHPSRLCQSIYLWNHACSLIGKRDKNRDWVYDDAKQANNAEALQYLDQAEDLLSAAVSEGDECKGVNPEVLGNLIDAVRAEIKRHP